MGSLALWFTSCPILTYIQPPNGKLLDKTVHDASSNANDADTDNDTPSTCASNVHRTTKIVICTPNFKIWRKRCQWLWTHISQCKLLEIISKNIGLFWKRFPVTYLCLQFNLAGLCRVQSPAVSRSWGIMYAYTLLLSVMHQLLLIRGTGQPRMFGE